VRNFFVYTALFNPESESVAFPFRIVFTLLEYIGLAVLVAISLGGFVAAVGWTLAVWLGSSKAVRH
jgi:hypothetical protein